MGVIMTTWLTDLAFEPPLRILAKAVLKHLPVSVHTRARWELSARPAYLLGLVTAAAQARRQHLDAISVIEFGVAGGDGLVALQYEAEAVEQATGIHVRVYGFDQGREGLPSFIGDHRDHPDIWRPGDYPMDEASLRARLTARTTLVLGNVAETVKGFFQTHAPSPIGFIAFDLDLYSSTRDALQLLRQPHRTMLWHTPVYFDDVDSLFNHRGAGELLAIEEFNLGQEEVRIDRWYGVKRGRPFPERPFLDKLYVAHDCAAVGAMRLNRPVNILPVGGEP